MHTRVGWHNPHGCQILHCFCSGLWSPAVEPFQLRWEGGFKKVNLYIVGPTEYLFCWICTGIASTKNVVSTVLVHPWHQICFHIISWSMPCFEDDVPVQSLLSRLNCWDRWPEWVPSVWLIKDTADWLSSQGRIQVVPSLGNCLHCYIRSQTARSSSQLMCLDCFAWSQAPLVLLSWCCLSRLPYLAKKHQSW